MWQRLGELHRCLWVGCLPLEAVHAAAVKAMLCCGHFTAARKQLAGEAPVSTNSTSRLPCTTAALQSIYGPCPVVIIAFCWDSHYRLSASRPSACCCAGALQTSV